MLYFLVFASSVVELAYELLWMRRFSIIFGATSTAGAIVLAAIFSGMAAGSAVFGRLVCRRQSPARLFAWIELALALSAALVEPVLRLYDSLVAHLYPWASGQPALYLLLQAGLCFIATMLPAFFLGGLLPVAGHILTLRAGKPTAPMGGLYGASLAGAAAGTLLVPTFLIPVFGAGAGYAAVLIANLVLAAAAWTLSDAQGGKRLVPAASHSKPAIPPPASFLRSLTALAFLSGVTTLSLEVLWARMLSLVHESSTYSFSLVLGVFLIGLSAGALISRVTEGNLRLASLLGTAGPIASGLLVMFSPRIFQAMTSGMEYTPSASGRAFPEGALLTVVYGLLLPGATCVGLLFPLILEAAKRSLGRTELTGRALGRLFAANTLGAVVGPLLTAFVLLPWAGLWTATVIIGMLIACLGAPARHWLWVAQAPHFRQGVAGSWKLGLATVVIVPVAAWMSDPASVPRARFDPGRGQQLVGIFEGVQGTLAVLQDEHSRWATFNNHYTLGGTASTGDERQQAHLPLLLHPAPRTAAFLGLGTGITAGAALLHPLEKLTVLEILPEAVEAAREHFGHANYNVIGDDRAEVLVGDARAFIRCSGRRFDVIVGDLVTPWRPGESLLYSQEHFEAVRRALEPGGLFCQWLPAFQLTEESFTIVTATFLDVFPDATLWRGDFLPDQPALALIGTSGGCKLDPAAVAVRASDLATRLDHANPYLADPAGLWLFLVGPLDAGDPRLRAARRNRDARPWLELITPLTQQDVRGGANAPLVGARLKPILDQIRRQPIAGTMLELLSPAELELRDAGAALWHASLLARRNDWEESGSVARRALAKLPPKLQLAVTGQVIDPAEPEPPLPR